MESILDISLYNYRYIIIYVFFAAVPLVTTNTKIDEPPDWESGMQSI